jgi:hypothetical protein
MEANMAKRTRLTLLALAGAALLGGCATGPYYDNYYGYAPAYGYPAYGPAYYDYPYVGPSVGIGIGATYVDRDYHHHSRDHRREWRGDHRAPSVQAVAPTPDTYRGPRNHAGEAIGPGYRPPPGSESPG